VVSLSEGKRKLAFAGLVDAVEVKYTKKSGKAFAVVRVEDFSGTIELMVWNDVYEKIGNRLVAGSVVAFQARVESDSRTETNRLVAEDLRVVKPDEAARVAASRVAEAQGSGGGAGGPAGRRQDPQAYAGTLVVEVAADRASRDDLMEIRRVLEGHPGGTPVEIRVRLASGEVAQLEAGDRFRVTRSDELLDQLAGWV
jgi:DNA polymerase-3 subunit alpha